MKANRRSFLAGLIGAGIAGAVPAVASPRLPTVPSPAAARAVPIGEIVVKTLRARAPQLAANVTQNNALFERLKRQRT